jgi:hypothetical protein
MPIADAKERQHIPYRSQCLTLRIKSKIRMDRWVLSNYYITQKNLRRLMHINNNVFLWLKIMAITIVDFAQHYY